jgi:hypothetical protein
MKKYLTVELKSFVPNVVIEYDYALLHISTVENVSLEEMVRYYNNMGYFVSAVDDNVFYMTKEVEQTKLEQATSQHNIDLLLGK